MLNYRPTTDRLKPKQFEPGGERPTSSQMLPKPQKRNNHPPFAGPPLAMPPLGLVGVSVRAAAEALAGLPIACVLDLYCDHDTALACPDVCHASPNWARLQEQIDTSPSRPVQWLPIGGLDLQPQVWAALAKSPHSILGCSVETVEFCKSPHTWSAAIASVHPHILPIRYQPHSPPGRWFFKAAWPTAPDPWFWQQACDGVLRSALFLATSTHVHWVGGSRLYVTPEHRYLGNVASMDGLEPPERATLETMIAAVHQRTALRGLIGIDYMRNAQVWPLEINPRPTASVEVVADLLGRNLYWEHVLACQANEPWPAEVAHPADGNPVSESPSGSITSPPSPLPSVVAKRVVYNGSEPLTISPSGFDRLRVSQAYRPIDAWLGTWTTLEANTNAFRFGLNPALSGTASICLRLADIPWPNSQVPPHEPICTLLAQVTTADAGSNIAASSITPAAGATPVTATTVAAGETLTREIWALLAQLETRIVAGLRR